MIGSLRGVGHRRFLRRPERVLLSNDDARVTERSRIHRRTAKAYLGAAPMLSGNRPEVTLRRGVEVLDAREAFGLAPRAWWIGIGTALGFARERDFLPWDNDIDVRVLLEYGCGATALDYAHQLAALFEVNGFEVVQEIYWAQRPMQIQFADRQNAGLRFDIYFFYEGVREGVVFNANAQTLREKPRHLIDNRVARPWPTAPDIMVQVPGPVEAYLEWRFGPGWRTPTRDPVELRTAPSLQPLPEIKVLTYGTWDGLHYGHLRLLQRAQRLGDRLIVGVVSDEICARKGKDPVCSEDQRAAVIAALEVVDEVFIQRELDQKEADIDRFGAHYLVVGDDWAFHPRFEQVRGYSDVELVYLKRTPDVSSTRLREDGGLVAPEGSVDCATEDAT